MSKEELIGWAYRRIKNCSAYIKTLPNDNENFEYHGYRDAMKDLINKLK